ncbi:MAG: hypothetical protein SOT81_03590 [Treponema sp.]|nr:hypothetical protein [Treponema sp.]
MWIASLGLCPWLAMAREFFSNGVPRLTMNVRFAITARCILQWQRVEFCNYDARFDFQQQRLPQFAMNCNDFFARNKSEKGQIQNKPSVLKLF